MPMLLPLQHASRERYAPMRKCCSTIQADSTSESFYCSRQTKKTFSLSFTQNLLSLILIVGLFHQFPLTQQYNDASTGSSTLVSRAYDAYGQLTSETTSLNGSPLSSWTQTWDAAGRRMSLNWNQSNTTPGAQYAFSYNSLGEMISSQNASETNSYIYGDNGLLSQKSTPSGITTFTRDKNGNIITAMLPEISTESLTYRADGKVSSYAISGPAGNETRNYKYDVGGRIAQEPYFLAQSTNNLSAGTQTASYAFDDLNIRLKQEITTADIANVVSEKDSFAQVILDSLNPNASTPTSWTSGYDAQGNLTTHNADFSNQSLTWDSFGHLVKVDQTNNNTTLNWSTVYDGLGRRIQTKSQGDIINYYYDPEVEFLELGHSVNGNRQWNLYGPDQSGLYGGAQGIGGLETCFTENTKTSVGIVNNYFGDVVGLISSGTFAPYPSALGAYGPMPGSSVNKALQPQWRGHYLDPTGFVYMGARYYDPQVGRFISPDPLGHDASLDLYSYCNGDPVNGLDPDGRCVEGMVTGQSYNIPSYAGALMGRMNPFFTTTQGLFSTAQTYNANYETFGKSHWNATITTFNPAYAAIKGGYEATTGFGMSYNNLGQDLSVRQRIGSGAESLVGALSMVGIAEGTSLVNSAVSSASVAAELTPFETMLAKVNELDFSTPRNGAVFYSGPGQGMRAASFAERTGGMTIDMTSGGQWLRENLGVFSRAEQDLIWQKASTPFAEGASGRINAFINGANPERAFRTIEEPILNANQNV